MSDANTLIARIRKNANQEVVVSLGEFAGHKLIDARVHAAFDDGEKRPTRRGICLRAEQVDKLIEALSDARIEAQRRGWLNQKPREGST
jgi:hypothetical protein